MKTELQTLRGRILSNENSKLGNEVFSFSLPAISTCPGSSELCRSACYATKGHFRRGNIQRKYSALEQIAREDYRSLASKLVEEIRERSVEIVRIHASGDFFSVDYVRLWALVIAQTEETKYYAYTRSWRIPEIREILENLYALVPEQLKLWYSCDRETGIPEVRPEGIGIAWMMQNDDDLPPVSLTTKDIVFRVKRKTPQKRVGLALVCPKEQGSTSQAIDNLTCGKCRFCLPNQEN